jgi:hypothetical protein
VANCGNCNTSKDLCDTCQTKYAPATDKKSCSNQCDAHCLQCTNSHSCATCDVAKNYYRADSGRCVYCAVPYKADKSGPDNGKAGNTYFFDKTNGYCAICDKNANGCASKSSAAACKSGMSQVGGLCQTSCATGATLNLGGKGTCFTCGSHVTKGYCADEKEGLRCDAGYHVQRAGQGICCDDDSSAIVHGLSALVAGLAAVAAMMH